MRFRSRPAPALAPSLLGLWLAGCSANGSVGTDGSGGSGGAGASAGIGGTGGTGGVLVPDAGGDGGLLPDPVTCDEAAAARTYVGCDFWPTVTANAVWSIFDFAVVAANNGDEPASVRVTIGDTDVATAEVPPNDLTTIYLPWVPTLKGPEGGHCNEATTSPQTARIERGAYHLVSTRPISVYQFNPLQYASVGGRPGKDWTQCKSGPPSCPFPVNCSQTYYTYSNDASLLLPTTALTGNYRVAGRHGYFHLVASYPEFMTITGTEDGTTVNVWVAAQGTVEAGGGIAAVPGGGTMTLSLDAGDVAELFTYTKLTGAGELSGSLIQADRPVQVIAGTACSLVPDDKVACDHTEEALLPAETLGKRYFVVPPTGPRGDVPGHVVRIYGNFDGTQLSYPGAVPLTAPTTLNAGEWADLGILTEAFEVTGDHSFAVATFQLAGSLVDPDPTAPDGVNMEGKGDPSMSQPTAVEQYRTKYVFLAPLNYDLSFADVVLPLGAQLQLDGMPVTTTVTPIGATHGVARLPLGPVGGGRHVLVASEPVGLQVIGYGRYTSYQYPGGMNLARIAPPPIPPR